jgi:hypothetical protein
MAGDGEGHGAVAQLSARWVKRAEGLSGHAAQGRVDKHVREHEFDFFSESDETHSCEGAFGQTSRRTPIII